MAQHDWLIFVPVVPATPSSLRVTVWRRMRAAGAVALQNGVWVLPRTNGHEAFIRDLLAEIVTQGGRGVTLASQPFEPTRHDDLIALFRADRAEEYAELCERCAEFRAEIAKETSRQRFIFAELEENDDDLQKLMVWLRRIQARDFFPGPEAAEATSALQQCMLIFQEFSQLVYEREGVADRRPSDETSS